MLTANEFDLLVPWYLNGSLGDDETVLVDLYLTAHPAEQAKLQWNASLRRAVGALAEEIPDDIGLARIMAAVRSRVAGALGKTADDSSGGDPALIGVLPPAASASGSAGAGIAAGGQALAQVKSALAHDLFETLLARVSRGDKAARDQLFEVAYGELKRLAHVRLYQGGRSNLLDTTALVNEAYIRFVQSAEMRSEDRRSFFAFASQVMRNVIVDTARTRLAQRHGGGNRDLTLSTQLLDQLASGEQAIMDVHEALLALEAVDPRLARVVEMRYYGGYSEAEIAETLGVTERTVQRDWNKARLMLKEALRRS